MPKLHSSIRQFGECGVSSDLAQQSRLYGGLQRIISDNHVSGLARLWGERREVWRSPWGNSSSSSDRLQNPFIHRQQKKFNSNGHLFPFHHVQTFGLSEHPLLRYPVFTDYRHSTPRVSKPSQLSLAVILPMSSCSPLHSVSTLANIAWSLTSYLTHDNRGSLAELHQRDMKFMRA